MKKLFHSDEKFFKFSWIFDTFDLNNDFLLTLTEMNSEAKLFKEF